LLFRPFNVAKWFTLGFSAWLSTLGEGGGGNFNFNNFGGGGRRTGPPRPPGSPSSGGPPYTVDQVKHFLVDYAVIIVPVFLLLVALGLLLMWVRARGKFVFMENVAYNRDAVTEPWKRLRPLANSFFRFELLLGVLMLLALAVAAMVGYVVALPDLRAGRMGAAGFAAIVIAALMVLGAAVVFGVVRAMTEDFVMPLMYLRGVMVGPAWAELRRDVLPGNAGTVVVFYLMRIVLALGEAFVMVAGTCLTCCVAGLPYLSAVVFLPIHVFNRSYSLYFLRQFGPQYNLLVDVVPPMAPAFPVVHAGWQQTPDPQQWPPPGQPPPPPPPPPPT
jgi:hypothetical protein